MSWQQINHESMIHCWSSCFWKSIHLSVSTQAHIWPSWCSDLKTLRVSGAWRPSTPCVRWNNPGLALIFCPFSPSLHLRSDNLILFFTLIQLLPELYPVEAKLFCLFQIRSQAQFQDMCQQHVRTETEGMSRSGCCPSWSLGNYLAVLMNASCCLSLTSHQVH